MRALFLKKASKKKSSIVKTYVRVRLTDPQSFGNSQKNAMCMNEI